MADVEADLEDWSTTASNNKPSNSTVIGSGLDDNLQQIQATVRQYLSHQGGDKASGATVDLSTATGWLVDVTGTTTITAFGTVSAGRSFLLQFDGALTLTHNATSLKLPGNANITTAAGDMALMVSEGSGNWRCASYLDRSSVPYDQAAVDINGGTIDGAVIGGASAAAITGTTVTTNTGLVPDTDDGAYLGQSGTAFSDLFLASGGVINWNAGDVTLTHSANTLTVAGGTFATAALTCTTFTSTGIDDNAAGATAMTITSDEDIGIGETSPGARLHVKDSATTVAVFESTGSSAGVNIGTADTTKGILLCHGNGTGSTLGGEIRLATAADHDTVSDYWTFAASSTELRIGSQGSGTAIQVYETSDDVEITSGNLVIGTSGKGIDFSATSDAAGMTSELLDDYEEGTWTPVLSDGTNDATLSVKNGGYIKVGRMVYVQCQITVTSLGSMAGSNTYIEGLPYTPGTGSNNQSAVHCASAYNLNTTATENVCGQISSGVARMVLQIWKNAGAVGALNVAELTATSQLTLAATYYV